MRAPLIALVGSLLLLPDVTAAQMYRWQDSRGTVHYSNAPEHFPGLRRARTEPDSRPGPMPEDHAVPSLGTARIPFMPGSPILVTARVAGGGPITLMLDTGADRTMIAPHVLTRLGISTADAPQAEIRGVTGTGYGQAVYVASVEVGDARVGPLRIIAHDADLERVDGLLGRDFLEHFTVTIDARERIVTLAPR
jgi:hypothetical protein